MSERGKAYETRELEVRILEGLASPAREMTGEEWSRLGQTLRAELVKTRKDE